MRQLPPGSGYKRIPRVSYPSDQDVGYWAGALRHLTLPIGPSPPCRRSDQQKAHHHDKKHLQIRKSPREASLDRIRNEIPKHAIQCQGLVQAISRYRFEKQISRGRSREHVGSSCPEPWYRAAGHSRSSTKALLPKKPATSVSVIKLYYQKMKIQPVAGDGRPSTKNWSCTTRKRKSSRPPGTAVPAY